MGNHMKITLCFCVQFVSRLCPGLLLQVIFLPLKKKLGFHLRLNFACEGRIQKKFWAERMDTDWTQTGHTLDTIWTSSRNQVGGRAP